MVNPGLACPSHSDTTLMGVPADDEMLPFGLGCH